MEVTLEPRHGGFVKFKRDRSAVLWAPGGPSCFILRGPSKDGGPLLSWLPGPQSEPRERNFLVLSHTLWEPWGTRGVSVLSPTEERPAAFSSAPFGPAGIGHYVSQPLQESQTRRACLLTSQLRPHSFTCHSGLHHHQGHKGGRRWGKPHLPSLIFLPLPWHFFPLL